MRYCVKIFLCTTSRKFYKDPKLSKCNNQYYNNKLLNLSKDLTVFTNTISEQLSNVLSNKLPLKTEKQEDKKKSPYMRLFGQKGLPTYFKNYIFFMFVKTLFLHNDGI